MLASTQHTHPYSQLFSANLPPPKDTFISDTYFSKSKKVRITLKMTSPLQAPMWPPPGADMHIINNYCNILSSPFYILNLDTVWVGIGVLVSKLMHLSMQMHVSYVPDRLRQSTSSAANAVYQCPSSVSTFDHSFVARPGDISNTKPPRTHISTPMPCPPADRRGRK